MTIPFCTGLHGQTFITSNLARSTQFLTEALGLRLLKRTVHHHDPRLPVSVFGFDGGATTIITYIEWSPVFFAIPAAGLADAEWTRRALDAPRVGDFKGRWGAGTNHHLALHTESREQLLKWKRRLSDTGIHVTGPYHRNYFHAIYFRDPDGAIYEIATTEPGFSHDEEILGSAHRDAPADAMVGARREDDISAETWPEEVPEITSDMRLRGFHHITSVATDIDSTTAFFVERVGLDLIKRTDYLDQEDATHYYYSATQEPRPGGILTFFGFPGFEPGRLGSGLAHHITLASHNEGLEEWRERMLSWRVDVGPIEDLTYYRAATFRDPNGHLFQIATPPVFTIDEDDDALGERLCLPPSLDARREEIERFHALRPAPTPAVRTS